MTTVKMRQSEFVDVSLIFAHSHFRMRFHHGIVTTVGITSTGLKRYCVTLTPNLQWATMDNRGIQMDTACCAKGSGVIHEPYATSSSGQYCSAIGYQLFLPCLKGKQTLARPASGVFYLTDTDAHISELSFPCMCFKSIWEDVLPPLCTCVIPPDYSWKSVSNRLGGFNVKFTCVQRLRGFKVNGSACEAGKLVPYTVRELTIFSNLTFWK